MDNEEIEDIESTYFEGEEHLSGFVLHDFELWFWRFAIPIALLLSIFR